MLAVASAVPVSLRGCLLYFVAIQLRACVRLRVVSFLLLAAACGDGNGSGEVTPSEATAAVTESASTEPTTTPSEATTTVTESTTTERTAAAAPATDGPLAGIGEVELVAEGFQFTEGPQWMADDGVLLFTDFAGTIFQVAPDDEISEFRSPSDGANGLAVDTEGRLLAAERNTRRVTRTESDGTVTPIAEKFEGIRLNQPNDIAVRSDDTIYFTDPYYGEMTTELDFHGVFRIAADGSLTAERRGAITEQPNGVVLSPDESRLYVSNQAADMVWVFDVADDGSLSEARTFVTTGDGPDGMAVDDGRQPVHHHRRGHRGLRSRRRALGRHPRAAVARELRFRWRRRPHALHHRGRRALPGDAGPSRSLLIPTVTSTRTQNVSGRCSTACCDEDPPHRSTPGQGHQTPGPRRTSRRAIGPPAAFRERDRLPPAGANRLPGQGARARKPAPRTDHPICGCPISPAWPRR